MTILKCTAENCAYNKDEHCIKDSIVVEGEHADTPSSTSCKSFELKCEFGCEITPEVSPKLRGNTRGDIGGDIGGISPTHSPYYTPKLSNIECSAETCIFNKKGCCDAKEICVGSKTAKTEAATECDSFVKSK